MRRQSERRHNGQTPVTLRNLLTRHGNSSSSSVIISIMTGGSLYDPATIILYFSAVHLDGEYSGALGYS